MEQKGEYIYQRLYIEKSLAQSMLFLLPSYTPIKKSKLVSFVLFQALSYSGRGYQMEEIKSPIRKNHQSKVSIKQTPRAVHV